MIVPLFFLLIIANLQCRSRKRNSCWFKSQILHGHFHLKMQHNFYWISLKFELCDRTVTAASRMFCMGIICMSFGRNHDPIQGRNTYVAVKVSVGFKVVEPYLQLVLERFYFGVNWPPPPKSYHCKIILVPSSRCTQRHPNCVTSKLWKVWKGKLILNKSKLEKIKFIKKRLGYFVLEKM